MRRAIERNLNVESMGVKSSYARKQALYLCLSMTALLLSAFFHAAEKQFLVLAIIMGARWIADGIDREINILIK